MKKRIVSILLVAVMLFGITSASGAYIPNPEINPQASLYLAAYAVTLEPLGDGEMYIDMTVEGTTRMTKLGVVEMLIEERTPTGTWHEFDTLYGLDNPDFYGYNEITYLGEYNFEGTVGNYYRVTLLVFAQNANGYDSGEIVSVIAPCR